MKPIFPEPKEVYEEPGLMVLSKGSRRVVRVCEKFPSALAEAAHARLKKRLEELGAIIALDADRCGTIELVIRPEGLNPDHDQKMDFAPRNRDQAYVLQVTEDGAIVTAANGVGLLYGVVTLCQLLELDGDDLVVPKVTIRDWPDMQYRGLFAESRWGMDLMSLDDWKDAVDYLLDMKYNVLTVGVYNCWPAQYGDVSEWLMLPLSSFPQVKKEQFIDYYSAREQTWKHLRYLPRMYEEDFFGQLVAYGASRGMIVRPHFNTPGHNSLLPRLLPQISARDEEGNPTGYGFCLSCDETYEVMFKIIDEIVDRYLLPNGSKAYHIAADEVYPLVGMHPDKLYERLSPWCRCGRCREHSEGENYVQYIERIVGHLHDKGITLIGMWYDQLVRGGVLNEDLTRHFDEIGAREDIVLHWWDYGDFFDTTYPKLGFRRWVTPMTGYFYQTSYRGHLENIYLAERLGQLEDCEGTESYGVFDPAFHRHFAAQSEWSWNFQGGGSLQEFRLKYARALFGDDWESGNLGLEAFSLLVDNPVSANLAYSLFRYGYDYGQSEEQATARDNYPQSQVTQLAQTNPSVGTGQLQALAGRAERALSLFEQAQFVDDSLRQIYLIECRRLAAMARGHVAAAQAVRVYQHLCRKPLDQAQRAATEKTLRDAAAPLQTAVEAFDVLHLAIEEHRESYLQPHMLRELSLLREFLVRLHCELGTVCAGLQEGKLEALPVLETLQIQAAPWVG